MVHSGCNESPMYMVYNCLIHLLNHAGATQIIGLFRDSYASSGTGLGTSLGSVWCKLIVGTCNTKGLVFI